MEQIIPEPNNIHHHDRHAIIIGGGLAGTSTAYMLAASGWKITLIERRDQLASEASGNHAGIVMPLISHISDSLGVFYYQGFQATLEHIRRLNLSNEIWRPCGVVDVNLRHAAKELKDICIPAHSIERLSFLGHPGFYMREGGHIDVPGLCAAQIAAYPDTIRVVLSQDVLTLHHKDGRWQVDTTTGTIATSKTVIIASSYDALRFEQTAWLPLQRVRGQVTLLPKQPIEIPHVVCMEGYITPAQEGYHHVGATYQRDSSESAISIEDHRENLEILETLYGIKLAEKDYAMLKGRVGFRCATPDRRAVVGPVPIYDLSNPVLAYYPGLYINAAHGSRGLTSCILSAKQLSAIINGANEKQLDLVLPSRFIIRQLKRLSLEK